VLPVASWDISGHWAESRARWGGGRSLAVSDASQLFSPGVSSHSVCVGGGGSGVRPLPFHHGRFPRPLDVLIGGGRFVT
jgi:hypothetical protein